MTKAELESYWMMKGVQLRFTNNPTIVNSYLPFKADAAKYNLDIASLEAIMPAELVIGTGYTLDQNVAKINCSKFWDTSICKVLKGFSLKVGSNTFFDEVNFTESKLNGIKLPEYYGEIVSINTACKLIILDPRYIAGSYAVTSAVLTAGMAMANTFLASTGQAGQVISTKKQTGAAIRGWMKTLQMDLKIMDNDVYGIVSTTFMGQYFSDRKIDKNVIHNTINLLAVDSLTGVPINKVFAKNDGATKGDYTNIDGIATLHKQSGTNIITFSHKDPKTKLADYIPQTLRVTAKYKKAVSLTVQMVRGIVDTPPIAEEEKVKPKAKPAKAIVVNEEVKPVPAVKEAVATKKTAVKSVVKGKGKK